MPITFNISINPFFGHIIQQENHKYAYLTDEFPCNLIRAYADDAILIAIWKSLQKIINEAEIFDKFVNIKLNIKKCEVFKFVGRSTNRITIRVEGKKLYHRLKIRPISRNSNRHKKKKKS
jgi:hypothetical protein